MDDNLVMHWLKRDDLALKTVSYAQNHEDILLARALPHREGLYVDVGANHPVFHSVTRLFTDRGWAGINIEPSPPVFAQLQADRPDQINLNVGVGDVAGTLTFYETPTLHGWSSFRLELAEHYRSLGRRRGRASVPVQTLAQICAEHVGDRTIDFLKVDAEGFEQQVLVGADFARWRPRVLMVENAWPSLWEPKILAADYLYATFDGLNRFYVRGEDRRSAGKCSGDGQHPRQLRPLRVSSASSTSLRESSRGAAEPDRRSCATTPRASPASSGAWSAGSVSRAG